MTAELDAEIAAACGYEKDDLSDIPWLEKVDWAGAPSWVRGKPVPGAPNLIIHSMYGASSDEKRVMFVEYVPGDIRVYATPTQTGPGDHFMRFTINRASPGQLHEAMTREAFVTEVGREIEELVDLDTTEDECEKCGAADVPIGSAFCNSCGSAMPEEPEEAPEEPQAEVSSPS